MTDTPAEPIPDIEANIENKEDEATVEPQGETSQSSADIHSPTSSTESISQHESDTNKKVHKTTVETWKRGGAKQLCPNCGNEVLPLVRKQNNKISKNTLGTMCLISCWPICFLPFLAGGSDAIYLFCEKCGYFLGTYDRKTGKVEPSCAMGPDGQAKICKCKSDL